MPMAGGESKEQKKKNRKRKPDSPASRMKFSMLSPNVTSFSHVPSCYTVKNGSHSETEIEAHI